VHATTIDVDFTTIDVANKKKVVLDLSACCGGLRGARREAVLLQAR
jgi:hypothetical protein